MHGKPSAAAQMSFWGNASKGVSKGTVDKRRYRGAATDRVVKEQELVDSAENAIATIEKEYGTDRFTMLLVGPLIKSL